MLKVRCDVTSDCWKIRITCCRSDSGLFSLLGRGLKPAPGRGPGPGPCLGLNPLVLPVLLVLLALTPPCTAESLTITEGLEVVTSSGYDVRIAKARRASAAEGEELARSSRRPQAKMYADQTWLENRPEAIFGSGSSPLSEDHFLRYGLTVHQTITDFGRTRAGVDSARAGVSVQAGLLEQVRNRAALAFIDSYIARL